MRLAVSENGNKLDRVVILPTPRKFDDAMALIKKAIKELANDKKIKAVSGGIAGPLDKNKTMILNAPNLLDWKNKPLAKELQKIFKAPVFLENDAALAGLGEAVFGAGKGKKIVAYLTISTGVGGCRIVDGKIDENSQGFEPGHQIIFSDKNVITLENLVSGTAIDKKYCKKPY